MIGVTIATIIASVLINGIDAKDVNNVGFYSRTMVVTEVNEEEDIVTCADFNGEEWVFEGAEDWLEGDVCSMMLCDNGTTEIKDDIIVSTNYCGWVNEWGYDTQTKEVLYTF